MSLEQAIQENTAALKALAALLANAQVQVAAQPAAPVAAESEAEIEHRQQQERKAARQAESAADAPKPEKKTAKAEKPTPAAAPAPEPKAEAPTISLADLQTEGKKLLDAGKQADLKALVAKLGSTKLSMLPADKYAEALVELKKLTANL